MTQIPTYGMFKSVFLLCIAAICQFQVFPQSSLLVRSTLSASGYSGSFKSNENSYLIQQSVGQSGITGTISSQDYIVLQGFIQPYLYTKIKQNATRVVPQIEFKIFPNPVENILNISIQGEVAGKIKFEVFNVLGVRVYSNHLESSSEIKLDVHRLPSAKYTLKGYTNSGQFTANFIKK